MAAEYDYEYSAKWQRLAEVRATVCDKQIILLLGSSRSDNGISHKLMPGLWTCGGVRQVVFNFGIAGAGPLHQLIVLRRLLRAGVAFRHAVIEIFPPLLCQTPARGEEQHLGWARLDLRDLFVVLPYCFSKRRSVVQWWNSRRTQNRDPHAKVPWHERWRREKYSLRFDEFGWQPFFLSSVPREVYRVGVDRAFADFGERLRDFQVPRLVRSAMEQILALCRRRGIETTLLLCPEGAPFRYFYSDSANRLLSQYLAELQTRYGCSLIDARCWVGDELFSDAHHLLPAGAAQFSRRLGHELALLLKLTLTDA